MPAPRERPEAVSASSTVVLHGIQLQTLHVKAHSHTHTHTTHEYGMFLLHKLPAKLKPFLVGF